MVKPPFELLALQDAMREGRFRVQIHARRRRRERGFSQSDILDVILEGEVIESYPTSKPDPKCLMMKEIRGEPVYVVVAYDANIRYAYIITIHGYDPTKWIDPKTRKKKS